MKIIKMKNLLDNSEHFGFNVDYPKKKYFAEQNDDGLYTSH